MPKTLLVACVYLTLTTASPAQEDSKSTVSDAPLTADQIAVYRVVLKDYQKSSREALRLSRTTDPTRESLNSGDEGCIHGFNAEAPANVVHRLTSPSFEGLNVVLVDPHLQQDEEKKNDPQNLIRDAIDNDTKVSDKQLDDSVRRAFASGLFSLSEIVFDRDHLHAMVAYSFVCGGLCGHGNTLALQKVGKRWKIVKACSSWIS